MCAIASLLAFLLDLEQLTRIVSIGNLITYGFVTACGISLRFRQPETQSSVRSPNEIYMWIYVVSAFITAMLFMKATSQSMFVVFYIFAAITVGLLLKLCCIDQPNKPSNDQY